MSSVGIAIGHLHARVAHVNAGGIAALCPDRFNPAVLETRAIAGLQGERPVVGQLLEVLLDESPQLPRFAFGQLLLDEDVGYPAQPLAAALLSKLRRDAEHALCGPVHRTTIAVSPTLGDAARENLLRAARQAGWTEAALMDAPLAAVCYIESRFDLGQRLLVLDTQWGSPHASLIDRAHGRWRIVQTASASQPTIDQAASDATDGLVGTLQRTAALNPLADPALLARLKQAAAELCLDLERAPMAYARRTLFIDGRSCDVYMTARRMLEVCKPMVESSLQLAEQCMSRATTDWREVDQIMLLGPLSASAPFQELTASWADFPRNKIIALQPCEAAVYGAAIAANRTDPVAARQQRLPRVGLVMRGANGRIEMEQIFSGEEVLPARTSRQYAEFERPQSRFSLRFIAWHTSVSDAESVGAATFDFAEPVRRLIASMVYSSDGTLRVSVRDLDNAATQTREFNVWNGFAAGSPVFSSREQSAVT